MESGVSPSFIPHDTAQMTWDAGRRVRSIGSFSDIFMVISIVLFSASMAAGAGVFLYVQYLNTVSASKLAQLERAKAALDPSLITQLTRLDDRMNAADTLLGGHLAPSAFFDALSQATLLTVSFGTLDMNVADAKHVTLKMAGVAQSVNSIALQAELFGKNGIIANPIFSGISRQQDGVHFDLAASINPSAIGWARVSSTASSTAAFPGTTPAGQQGQQSGTVSGTPTPLDGASPVPNGQGPGTQ